MRRSGKRLWLGWTLALGLPLGLVVLFYLLRGRQHWMDAWVFGILRPFAQGLGRLWALVPFSVGECMTALFLLWFFGFFLRAVFLAVRRREWRPLFRRVGVLLAAVLWVWAAFQWMWNGVYYAETFTQRSGLAPQSYTRQELRDLTEYFARLAAEYSEQMERDEEGNFVADRRALFARGTAVYGALEEEFPFLEMQAVACKPIFLSRLQSILGFSGVYFPLTGEANVNTDFPVFLAPATMAHEMAHQRMIASEMEANFVAIAAAVSSGDEVFVYSGYLLGLIQLCNALYPVDPEGWRGIVSTCFTPALAADWNANSTYWRELESPLEDRAEEVYDAFLKGNGQEMGIESYGACVDLLVAYFSPRITG